MSMMSPWRIHLIFSSRKIIIAMIIAVEDRKTAAVGYCGKCM